MKKINLFLLTLLILAASAGCGNKPQEEIYYEQSSAGTENILLTDLVNKDPVIGLPAIDHETDTPPIPGMVRSRITNEWVSAEIAETRPIAVIIPNSKTASQFGLSKASVLYECNVEGSMTRLMGIWDDWTDLDKIGNIRSTRDYFVYWAIEWDAIFIHYGGPFYADNILSSDSIQNINCLLSDHAYFRDAAKNTTDDAFTSTDIILKSMESHKYPLNYRSDITEKMHFSFATPVKPNDLSQYHDAINAKMIDMSSTYPVTNCYFKFNSDTGLYERFQHLSGESDGPHIDMMNGEQLTFKNVIVQNTYYEQRDQQGYLAFQCHDDARNGWFFTNGKGIHITWRKTKDDEPTRYYDDQGNEIELNMGKTMILIIQDGDSFYADGKKLS